jgi:hypothetical protein
MRTALQQAFARLEELHPSLFDIHTEKGRTFVNEFSKFLEVEREQVTLSHINGQSEFDTKEYRDYNKELANAYYNLTFKSE